MHDRLAPGELFRADLFLRDFLAQLAACDSPKYPEAKFFLALRIATENDERRFVLARLRALDAAELAQHRHTVVSDWAEQGTTGTRRQVTQIDQAYWNSKLPRPDPDAEGRGQHFRKKPPLAVSQERARHMREIARQKRAAAAEAAGAA